MVAVRDADATRARILAAAVAEFGAHGLAGARVDRIAAAAEANKSLIYAYFGNKDELFDRVVEEAFTHLHETVELTPRDMSGYATALFDYLADHPDLLRIDAWRRLERPDATEPERAAYAEKVAHLTAVRPTYGVNGQYLPADVIALVIAIASAWANTPDALRPHTTQDRDRQRELVHGAVSVLTKSQQRRREDQ
jgi:AcrR family transcriptional regulator